MGFTLSSYRIISKPPVTHVFLEAYATNPAFSQMISFAKLPPKVPKIIAWHRFTNRKDVVDLTQYNTTEIPIRPREGFVLQATQAVLKEVQKRHEQNPQMQFIFHVNRSHQEIALYPFLQLLPKENINHIYLYEDGYGELFRFAHSYDQPRLAYEESIPKIKQSLSKPNPRAPITPLMGMSLHKLYPVTYVLTDPQEIKRIKGLKELSNWLADAHIEPIDLHQESFRLTQDQKELIYKLTNFDEKSYRKKVKDNPVILFAFGVLWFENDWHAQFNLLKKLTTEYQNTGDKPYVWVYKFHPARNSTDKTTQMEQAFPTLIQLPSTMPFEVLILAGLTPDKTVGYGSSFFHMLSSDQVLGYIQRHGDPYINPLLKLGKIKPEQIMKIYTP